MSTRTAPTKFRGHNVTYIVDEPNRAVVCQINDCRYDATRIVFPNYNYGIINPLLMPSVVKAVAVCAPEDTFNAEVGKQIAFARARKKYWMRIQKSILRAVNAHRVLADNISAGAAFVNKKLADAEHSLEAEIEYATREENE